jgi:hypothetical protein
MMNSWMQEGGYTICTLWGLACVRHRCHATKTVNALHEFPLPRLIAKTQISARPLLIAGSSLSLSLSISLSLLYPFSHSNFPLAWYPPLARGTHLTQAPALDYFSCISAEVEYRPNFSYSRTHLPVLTCPGVTSEKSRSSETKAGKHQTKMQSNILSPQFRS